MNNYRVEIELEDISEEQMEALLIHINEYLIENGIESFPVAEREVPFWKKIVNKFMAIFSGIII
jgi:hypothetical protein